MTPTLPLHSDQQLLLFTDLDGTLIDHHSYSAEQSHAALQLLSKRKVPLIFCSSKTYAEQLHLQRQIGMVQPFIVENGSAVAMPKGYFSSEKLPADTPYELVPLVAVDAAMIRKELLQFPDIKGYFNAGEAAVQEATGLQGAALSRACDRLYTETLITPLSPEQVERLRRHLEPLGLMLSRGGRFHTIQASNTDKGRALRWLAEAFSKHWSATPLLAACGDSNNDAPMLATVDFPFLVQQPGHKWAPLDIPNLIKIEAVGPAGFSKAVEILLGAAAV